MTDEDDRPPCKYGINCYRRNEKHKERFSHPKKDVSAEQQESNSHDTDTDTDSQRSTSPSAKRRKTMSSHGSDSDAGADQPEMETTSNGSENPSGSPPEIDRDTTNTSTDATATAAKTSTTAETSVPKFMSSNIGNNISAVNVQSEFINKNLVRIYKNAQRIEYEKLLESPAQFIYSKFLVKMPSDFYEFWSFCEANTQAHLKPENRFSKLGFSIVGPFDVLAKKFHDIEPFEPGEYLRHWRFYYDTPEFQTIMVKDKTGIHYGYWRDGPNGECLIARNDANKSCEFTFIADNIFGAVLYFLENDVQLSPFNKASALTLKKSIETDAHTKNISLTSFAAKLKTRNLETVCRTFHKAGLVVPYDRKTDIGYRQLGKSDANLKKILGKIVEAKGDPQLITVAMDELQPLITASNIACDESDFGSAIELGTDLFCFGAPELHADALQLLATGYKLVNKPQYIAIAKAHLEKRLKGSSGLSILGNG